MVVVPRPLHRRRRCRHRCRRSFPFPRPNAASGWCGRRIIGRLDNGSTRRCRMNNDDDEEDALLVLLVRRFHPLPPPQGDESSSGRSSSRIDDSEDAAREIEALTSHPMPGSTRMIPDLRRLNDRQHFLLGIRPIVRAMETRKRKDVEETGHCTRCVARKDGNEGGGGMGVTVITTWIPDIAYRPTSTNASTPP